MIIRNVTPAATFGTFAKVAVDIERGVLAIGCELHTDCMEELLADGSRGNDVWGANVFPEEERIDVVSLINIRPAAGNRSTTIEQPDIRNRVEAVIQKLLFSTS